MHVRALVSAAGSQSRNRSLQWSLLGLSAFDAAATDAGLRLEAITEGNPLAALLYETHPTLFYVFKIGLPLLLLLMGKKANSLWLSRLTLLAAVLYGILAVYHLAWLILVLIAD